MSLERGSINERGETSAPEAKDYQTEIQEYLTIGNFDRARDVYEVCIETASEKERTEIAVMIATELLEKGNERGAMHYLTEIPGAWNKLAALSETVQHYLHTRGKQGREVARSLIMNVSEAIDREAVQRAVDMGEAQDSMGSDATKPQEAHACMSEGDFDKALDIADTIKNKSVRAKTLVEIAWEAYRPLATQETEDDDDADTLTDKEDGREREAQQHVGFAEVALDEIIDPRDKMAAAMHLIIRGIKEGKQPYAASLAQKLWEDAENRKEKFPHYHARQNAARKEKEVAMLEILWNTNEAKGI